MFRAEDLKGIKPKKKQPYTSILPYLQAEEENAKQGNTPIARAVKKSVASPEERLKDNEALDHLAPPL